MPSSLHHLYQNFLLRLLHRPKTALLILLALTLLFAWQLPNLCFRTSVYELIIEDLPETETYESFKQTFGSDEIIRVVVRAENVFDPVTYRQVEILSKAAAGIEGVRRVISLPEIKKAVDPGDNWPLDKFARLVGPVDLFQKNIVSEDYSATILTLALTQDADLDRVIHQVNALIDEAPETLSLYQIGMPLVSQALGQFTRKDFRRLPPFTLLLVALILFLLFRRLTLILLPVGCVLLSVVWTFGFMAWIGIPLSMLTMIVPVFLIAVGTAYCLHIAFTYLNQAQRHRTPEKAVLATFSQVTFPTVVAVSTTVFGLGSLLVNHIPAIREFAILSCFGMGSLLAMLLTLFPVALSMAPLPPLKTEGDGFPRIIRFADRIIDWIIQINLHHRKQVLPIIGLFTLFCLIGIFRIRVETNPVQFFREDAPITQHFHDIYRDMSGSFPINVVMSGHEAGFFQNPENLHLLEQAEAYLETLPGVDKAISFADYMKLVNYALDDFGAESYALPEEDFEVRMVLNNYIGMLGEDMLERFADRQLSQANIILLTHLSSSRDFLEIKEQMLSHLREAFPQTLSWDVTGFGVVISASSHLLTKGQVKSLSITLVLVFGIMFVLFLSSRVGFIAIVPNLFPIVINFGLMGWLGIELSTVTSLIASIAIGLAVDDTIHYLVHYNREFKIDLDEVRALRETLRQVGRPILFTTLTISVGFSILTLSSFTPTAVFGLMMMITMVSALVGDAILLPSLMLHAELVTLWDLIRLRLGKDPERGIPLFKGLSRTEIHYILMAGTLIPVDVGQVLFRRGDKSDAMYALVSGELDVLADPFIDWDASDREPIARLHAGDIVGEMGLIRCAERSATVVAGRVSELLLINWKMIKRLQWLYPPTGYKFMINLSSILCNRLERTTQSLYEKSLMDGLTGVYNQKGFMDVLARQEEFARRYGAEITLCLVGVRFSVADANSSYHTRRTLLAVLARTLHGLLRQCDAMARIDFRTFALLLPHTSLENGEKACHRLLEELEYHPLEAEGIRLTLHYGLASTNADTPRTAGCLLERAAAALKAASTPR
jgi:hypothetical protein